MEKVVIGNATLYCGDCLEVMPLLTDSVDMIAADLPYGTTACHWDSVIPFEPLWKEYKRLCKGAVVLTASQPFASALVMSNSKDFKYEWIWEKTKSTGFLDCSYRPMRSHENICLFYEEKPTYNPQKTAGEPWKRGRVKRPSSCWGKQKTNDSNNETGERQPKSVLLIPNPNNGTIHPTQKPVALFEYMIKTYTNAGMTVLDNTMGSGTTGVAAMSLGRNFIGIEKDEKYFQIACERIAKAQEQLKLFGD